VGEKAVKQITPISVALALLLYGAGICTHLLYVRWSQTEPEGSLNPDQSATGPVPAGPNEGPSYRVNFVPLSAPAEKAVELPVVPAREVEQIRGLAGNQARIRGRIFKVGHSAKSNTYFLNFGPSREALTAVIFASAVELFEKKKLPPAGFDGKEVELHGTVKDHPQFGLEVILDSPAQIKILQ
jgi:hypothetical protein